MTVKSEAAWERLIAILSISLLLVIGTFFGGEDKIGLYTIIGIVNVGYIWNYAITGRTLIFDKFGCTVKFCRYQRTYAWKDIEIKRKEQRYWGAIYKHSKGVFFSINHVYKPKWLSPTIYCMLFHPFTCFYVHPTEPECFNEIHKSRKAIGGIYLVEEKEFFSKMKEWGVEIEEKINKK